MLPRITMCELGGQRRHGNFATDTYLMLQHLLVDSGKAQKQKNTFTYIRGDMKFERIQVAVLLPLALLKIISTGQIFPNPACCQLGFLASALKVEQIYPLALFSVAVSRIDSWMKGVLTFIPPTLPPQDFQERGGRLPSRKDFYHPWHETSVRMCASSWGTEMKTFNLWSKNRTAEGVPNLVQFLHDRVTNVNLVVQV